MCRRQRAIMGGNQVVGEIGESNRFLPEPYSPHRRHQRTCLERSGMSDWLRGCNRTPGRKQHARGSEAMRRVLLHALRQL